jgi:glucose uptake protein GlcU
MLGYVFAIISSVFYSLYVVPRKLSKLSPVVFSLFMSTGFSFGAIVLYLLQPVLNFHEIPSLILLWSVVAGVIWAVSFVSFVISIDLIGLSRSNQWKNLQGPVGVMLSLIILGELATVNPIFALLAALSIFVSALFFTTSLNKESRINLQGVYLASFAALGFGSVAVIQKYVTAHVGVYSQQVVWSISIAMSLLIYILAQKKLKELTVSTRKDILLGLGAGFLYLGASFFQLFSFRKLDASISFTIIQMNAVWTIAIGIFLFKEIDLKKYYKRISLGFVFTFLGIVLLVFARK